MPNESPPLILVADDDPDVSALLCKLISGWGFRARAAGTKAELMAELFRERPAVVLLDLQFGDIDGLELLRQLLEVVPDLTVAMLTGHGSIEIAVTAMRLGAYDFLTKPPDVRRLRVIVNHAVEKQALAARVKTLESLTASPPGVRLMGDSPAMQRVVALIRSVAPTDATVLVLGESGTGKELAARTVHELSRRAAGPFVPLNMAALPRELAESLLFGHERGAFTGADRAQPGACEMADGGTLFLDEMGEMDPALQAKLLRFLQERTVQRVGSAKTLALDVRVVAATNRDLAERVRAGLFREDLYYRLNVVPVVLPALRERREDIPLLAARFLQKAAAKYHREGLSFSPEAVELMTRYDWPGNVRQLENLIERVAILCKDAVIGPQAFADEMRDARTTPTQSPPDTITPLLSLTPPPVGDVSLRRVDQIEKQAITDALRQAGGSVRNAAHALGLSQATIYRKLKRYAIDLGEFASAGGTVT